jgi:hypothetical protein
VIYVNFNYRLGPLGFPQGQEADNRGALNLASKDQLAALEWVQLHIETFGGDKDKVFFLYSRFTRQLNIQSGHYLRPERGVNHELYTIFEPRPTSPSKSRGTIRSHAVIQSYTFTNIAFFAQIFESGSQATSALFTPEAREANWQNFVRGVPSCASTATSGSTFGCLRNASSTEIFEGLSVPSPDLFPWDLVIDGPGGIIPDLPSVLLKGGQFARLPFIAGTNLDEGSRRICITMTPFTLSIAIGTLLTPQTINSTADITELLVNLSSPSVSLRRLKQSTLKLLQLYPDIPALGQGFWFSPSSIY